MPEHRSSHLTQGCFLASIPQLREFVTFGDYELDCSMGELRRNGTIIKLAPQPVKVLSILVTRAGEVVTRKELAETIWGADTHVDFEHGLNFAVRQIRSALEDDSENPRFLETIPKRGYRFIAPVAHRNPNAVVQEPVIAARSGNRLILAVALVVVIAAVGAFRYLKPPSSAKTENIPIVLADFANHTGDSVFDGTLLRGLSVQLEQSPSIRLVSDEQVHETLRMMGRSPDTALSPEIAREVCQRANASTLFEGSIDLVGTKYSLTARAVDCSSGDLLASAAEQADGKDHVLDALSSLASDIRGKMEEPLSSIRKYNVSLASVTTPNLEALHCYTEGLRVLSKFDYPGAISWFQKAVEFDSNFAMAYWAMGDSYAILGEDKAGIENTRKAFELREHVSEREKALIEAHYYYYVLGDVEKARRSCELLAKLYPFSEDAHNSIAVFAETVGQYGVGLTEYSEALHLAPYRSFLYRDVAYTYLLLDRVNDASAEAKKAHEMHLDENLAAVLYSIAFYGGDRGEMARQVASVHGKPEEEALLLALEADTLAYLGQLGKARIMSHRATESAERAEKKEASSMYYASSALREALLHNPRQAQQQAALASRYSGGRDTAYGVGLAFLYSGNLNRGNSAIEELATKFPDDTVVKCNYLPTLRAKAELLRSNPARAIDLLSVASSCEIGLPAYSYYNWPNLYPIYVRGEAYLAAHDGAKAAAEFKKILVHRGLALNEPIAALAHLQLGRSYAVSGDLARARAAYQDFLTIWKDADTQLQILKDAETEYAKLL